MLIALGLACSRPAERASLTGLTRVYRCEDGYRFVARFEPERVWLFLGQQTLSLPQIPSTSGVHFTDGRVTFREQANQASTEAPGQSHTGCANQPAAVPWEEARLRGVDFRATGQDSAWTLEIDDGSGIVFGGVQIRLAFPAGATGTSGSDVIEQSSAGHSIRIERTAGECLDRTTGEKLDTVVRVVVDGTEYKGCGRRLAR